MCRVRPSLTATWNPYVCNPLNVAFAQTPINVVFAHIPINVGFAHTPINVAFARTPINVAFARTPISVAFACTPINSGGFYSHGGGWGDGVAASRFFVDHGGLGFGRLDQRRPSPPFFYVFVLTVLDNIVIH